jgi:hypothetical protein
VVHPAAFLSLTLVTLKSAESESCYLITDKVAIVSGDVVKLLVTG